MLFSVEFTINGYTVKTSGDTVALEEMSSSILQIRGMLAALPAAERPSADAFGPEEEKTITITRIVRAHDGEKETVRVFGEPYEKFGVAVYADSLKSGKEFLPPSLGSREMKGYQARLQMKNGKPVRVISIEPLTVPF